MSPYAQDIRDSRAAVERILDELGFKGYVFTIEAKEPEWRLHVECQTPEGWQMIELGVEPAQLRASLHDDATRERLREAWRARIAVVTRKTQGRANRA
jgi:hypothetical protein